MKKFDVFMKKTITFNSGITVEAKDEDEAIKIVESKWENGEDLFSKLDALDLAEANCDADFEVTGCFEEM